MPKKMIQTFQDDPGGSALGGSGDNSYYPTGSEDYINSNKAIPVGKAVAWLNVKTAVNPSEQYLNQFGISIFR